MPAYDDRSFSPPAPVVSAQVRNPETGEIRSSVLMLIDSGADVTLLPLPSIDSLGIKRSGRRYELTAFDGAPSLSHAVQADLVFLRSTYKGLFLVIDREVGILGRDVLNHVCLLLDGPRLSWEEQLIPQDT